MFLVLASIGEFSDNVALASKRKNQMVPGMTRRAFIREIPNGAQFEIYIRLDRCCAMIIFLLCNDNCCAMIISDDNFAGFYDDDTSAPS